MSESTPVKASVVVKLHEQYESLERILESAVVVSWADLMRGRSVLIHIEYGFASNAKLEHLKVWSSIKRGYWLLACTYWMSASESHDAGVHFDNGCESEDLAHILEVVMQHQNLFSLPHNLGRDGLLQIGTPTEKQRKAAAASINDAVGRVNSLAKPAAKTVA
jgi:hypothetical protein